jgi:SEC-C motif domain protein
MLDSTARCPCNSGDSYGDCCGPLHAGVSTAPTAERLMRSRYSAFVVGDADYLLATWHPSTRPVSCDIDAGARWFSLEILTKTGGSIFDSDGTVEFRAQYREAGVAHEQHENSRFVRENRRWYYLDGNTHRPPIRG